MSKSKLQVPVNATLSRNGIFVNKIRIQGYSKEEEGKGREGRRGIGRGGGKGRGAEKKSVGGIVPGSWRTRAAVT